MTAHLLGLVILVGSLVWAAPILAAIVAELVADGRALRHESSARRSDAHPAAAQDQRDEALVRESLLAAFRPDALDI